MNKAQQACELRLAKEIADANLAFQAASPAERRVKIAEDVIASLKADRFRAQHGYVSLEPDGTCWGCALGAVFVALTDRVGKGKDIERVDRSPNAQRAMYRKLAPYFSRQQLMMIEAAYEGHSATVNLTHPDEADAAVAFGRSAGEWRGEARLSAIMRNIIRNNGTFAP